MKADRIIETGDGWRIMYDRLGVAVLLDNLRVAREGRTLANIEVSSFMQPHVGVLLPGDDLYLRSTSGKETIARQLHRQAGFEEIDWLKVLQDACDLAERQFLNGRPPLDLREVDPTLRPAMLLPPFIERGTASTLFGDGECIAGDTIIDGTGQTAQALAEATKPIMVWALSARGKHVLTPASAPFLKGYGRLRQFLLTDGRSVIVAGRHRFLTPQGWRYANDLNIGDALAVSCLSSPDLLASASSGGFLPYPPLTSCVACPSLFAAGAHHWKKTRSDCLGYCSRDSHQDDVPVLLAVDTAQECPPLSDDALAHSLSEWHKDGMAASYLRNRKHLCVYRPSSCDSSPLAHSRGHGEYHASSSHSRRLYWSILAQQLSQEAYGPGQPRLEYDLSAMAKACVRYQAFPLEIPPVDLKSFLSILAITEHGQGPYYDLTVPGYENYAANGIWHHNSLKSLLALAMGISVASGAPILRSEPSEAMAVHYIDGEWDEFNHAERLAAIITGANIQAAAMQPIYYTRLDIPLPRAARSLRRFNVEHQVGLTIVDSRTILSQGTDLQGTAEFYRAVRYLGGAQLVIDHRSKAAPGAKDNPTPIDSVAARNMPRRVWLVQATEHEDEVSESRRTVVLHDTKSNRRRGTRCAFHVDFVEDEDRLYQVGFTATDVRDVEGLRHALTASERIIDELRPGRAKATEISEGTGIPLPQVKARLSDLRRRGVVVKLGETMWGLSAQG